MPNPTRDELKQAAEAIINTHDKHVKWNLKDWYYDERSDAAKIARALLSAFEREEKMLEALKRIEPIIDALEYFSPGGADDGSIAKQIRAAIKAAEEGRDEAR